MVENPFLAFVSLIELDQKLDQLAFQKAKLNDLIHRVQQHVQQQERVVGEQCAQAHVLRKQISSQELEHKSLQTQEKKIRTKLDQVNTAKEYQAIEHELQAIMQQEEQKEEAIFTAWTEFERLTKQCHDAEHELQLLSKKTQEEIDGIQHKINELEHESHSVAGQRPFFVQKSPEEFVEKYESMRKLVKDPVVPVSENRCGACSTVLMSADLAQLRRHVLVSCKTCYRLLYMK